MQSSGQQPKEKIEPENAGVEDVKEQASSPLYEFPADQQGMVYPPPPSYYQNMQIPRSGAALPLQLGTGRLFLFSLLWLASTTQQGGCASSLIRRLIILKCNRQLRSPTSGFGLTFPYLALVFLLVWVTCGWGVDQTVNTVIDQETRATDVVE